MGKAILKLNNIAKSFGNVKVIHDISFTIEEGKIYALAGENGAGKSTLCNIISGSLKPNEGTIEYGGTEYNFFTIQQAKSIGIKMVHQELQILPLMTVEENIFIGDEIATHGFTDKRKMYEQTQELLKVVGLQTSPHTKVADLEIAGRQLLEIARAINNNAKIIILDEPTSSLSQTEIITFFSIIRKLKESGVSFLFISHRLEEVFELADEIIILKDGEKVADLKSSETDEKEVIRLMVGREYADFYMRKRERAGGPRLELKNISGIKEGMINNAYIPQNISFMLEEGEVLGIAGLVGAGRTELVRMIFGDLPIGSGQILVNEKPVKIKNSRDAIRLGMAWVTEDRKQEGLILEETLVRNISLPTVHKHRRAGIINDNYLCQLSQECIDKFKIKTTGYMQLVKNLSGGNQQKVVLGKWLSTEPKILVLDEPTRGIDVGAKAEIYKLINELTAQGVAILLISSELPEVMGMSDRIIVMYEGRISGELRREDFSEEAIMEHTMGRKINNEE